jgi:hypothetical protein
MEQRDEMSVSMCYTDGKLTFKKENLHGEAAEATGNQTVNFKTLLSGSSTNDENLELINGQAVTLGNGESLTAEESTSLTTVDRAQRSESRTDGVLQKQFTEDDMRELEDLLVKVNPLAEEFIPSSASASQSISAVNPSNQKVFCVPRKVINISIYFKS